jgi:hypothetical protein
MSSSPDERRESACGTSGPPRVRSVVFDSRPLPREQRGLRRPARSIGAIDALEGTS